MISPYYDSLIGKVVATGDNRGSALENMRSALSSFEVSGVQTNIPFLQFLIDQPEFIKGDINIKWIEHIVLPKFLKTVA
jgi:acetyl-CoA carboxylase biotin carboxylase subunit